MQDLALDYLLLDLGLENTGSRTDKEERFRVHIGVR